MTDPLDREPRPDPAFAEKVVRRYGEDLEEDRVAGDVAVSLGFVRVAVASLAPREWELVASWLFARLERPPMNASPAFAAHRAILGSLAQELRTYASQAGEPVGTRAELAEATTSIEERRLLEQLDREAEEYDQAITDAIESGRPERWEVDAAIAYADDVAEEADGWTGPAEPADLDSVTW